MWTGAIVGRMGSHSLYSAAESFNDKPREQGRGQQRGRCHQHNKSVAVSLMATTQSGIPPGIRGDLPANHERCVRQAAKLIAWARRDQTCHPPNIRICFGNMNRGGPQRVRCGRLNGRTRLRRRRGEPLSAPHLDILLESRIT